MRPCTSYETIQKWVDQEYLRIMNLVKTGVENMQKWAEESTNFDEIQDLVTRYNKFLRLVKDFENHKPTFVECDDLQRETDLLKYYILYGSEIIEQLSK